MKDFFNFKFKENNNQLKKNNEKNESKNWLEIEENAENAVVQIFAVNSIFNWLQPFKSPIQVTVSGTGFFINDNGYFVTNSHVVDQAKSVWIQIPSFGIRNIDAEIVSVCPERDLALLKLRNDGIEEIKSLSGKINFLQLGDSDLVHRTDKILALGYPLGQHYIKSTTGIISGKEVIDDQLYIQIDAAINPGSSGGPVLNEAGKVIGIPTAMISNAQNVGYIIPINELKNILDDLHSNLFLRKQSLGIGVQSSTLELVKYLNNPMSGGLYICKIFPNSLAQKVGIQEGDMIYEINGCQIDLYGDAIVPWSAEKIPFIDILSRIKIGQEIEMIIYRNGEQKKIKFKLEDCPMYPIRIVYPGYEKVDYEIIGGLVVMELTENHVHALFPISPELIKYERSENQTEPKLIISYIFPSAEIFRLKTINAGNIVQEVNGIKVHKMDEFREALKISLSTGFFTIKTEDTFTVLDIMHVLKDEYRLSQDYKYPLSILIKSLLGSINIEQVAQ